MITYIIGIEVLQNACQSWWITSKTIYGIEVNTSDDALLNLH